MKSIATQIALSFALFAGVATTASASNPHEPSFHITYGVSDWRTPIPEKREEYRVFSTLTLADQTLSTEQRAARIAKKLKDIRDEVQQGRRAVYEKVSEVRGVGNSATNKSTSSKTSPAKCIGPTKPDLITTPADARGAYKSGRMPADADVLRIGTPVAGTDIVSKDGTQVCAIKLKQSSKGRKVSYSEATFRIRPEQITRIVEAEVLAIMFGVTP